MNESINEFGHFVPKRWVEGMADENARLKAEVERLRASSFVTAVPVEEYEKLKAENERLRKAGDELDYLLTTRIMSYEVGHASWQWKNAKNAAKDGKPTA